MKVLHFYRTYFPDSQGGLEEAIRQICLSTKAHNVESEILTLSPNPHPRILNLAEGRVHRAKLDLEVASCSMGVEAFSMFRELEKWADIVHYHFPWPFADLVNLWSRSRKPYIVTYHSDIVRQRFLSKIYSPLMHSFLDGANTIVATSENYVRTSKTLHDYAQKIEIIPIGINEKTYPPVDKNIVREIKAKFGNNFFLFIGVLRKYKGLHILLDALSDARFSVVIAGKGPEEHALKQQADSLGLSNVHFAGHVSNEMKVALISCCKGVVLPSHLRSEAFGVSLVEGAMLGKPLISMEIGTGTSYVNRHNETGLVVQKLCASSLAACLNLLNQDEKLNTTLGANSRTRFQNIFSSSIMGAAYAQVYTAAQKKTI